ncbi:hypothetical protein H0H92_012050 [Tricholoma furcatifolium]|nr:hypothetical protein H0H92_012050 [Tricholoma furcatifolium]
MALTEDSNLYEALKCAHSLKKYDMVRSWNEYLTGGRMPKHIISADASSSPQVAELLIEIRPAMVKLVTGSLSLPPWLPASGPGMDPQTAEHIRKLRIPCLNGKPNVLLYELGSFENDSMLAARLENIFVPNHHTFLVNTSGSGKTRLLLEGLCRSWGFYFTSMVDSSLLGSTDVQNSIRQYVPDSVGFRPILPSSDSPQYSQYESLLDQNRLNAKRIFSRVFLARLHVFNLFIDIMNEQGFSKDSNLTAYKQRWLLLQLQPSLIHSKIWDIFDDITRKLSHCNESYINSTTQTLLARARRLCVDKNTSPSNEAIQTPIFCVLDEAQYAATQHSSAFRSEDGNASRPILREIVRSWEGQTSGQGVFMVVAGTGISKDVVDQAMASAIMKESKYRWCSDTGAFDKPIVQRRYLEKFLPLSLLSSPSGIRLLERVWYWLHGRHRFTAGYVAELLDNGFQNPHRLLNKYIEFFTDFMPTDAQQFVDAEGSAVSISSRYRLDFRKLTKSPAMIDKVHELTTHYLMRSAFPGSLGKDEKTYVEYGFARFTDSATNTVAIDEPLILLSATHWINKNHRTSYSLFAKEIHLHTSSHTYNGFENYLAFCLNLAFSQPQRVDKVFSFCGPAPLWACQEAELVSLYHTSNGIEVSPVRQSSISGPSFTLGVNAKTTDETSAWLKHENAAPICFPHQSMGPDLFFVLRLADASLLWVALQAKYSSGKNGSLLRLNLRRAMRSITPSQFFIDKEGNPFSPSTDPNLVANTLASLESLPQRRDDAGTYSLLRVVATFPAEPGLKRCIEEDPDSQHHPIGYLNMKSMEQLTRKLSPTDLLTELKKGTSGSTLVKRTRKISGLRPAPRKRLKI